MPPENDMPSSTRATSTSDRYDQVLGLLSDLKKDMSALESKLEDVIGDTIRQSQKIDGLSNSFMIMALLLAIFAVLGAAFIYFETGHIEDMLSAMQEAQANSAE
jgi:hypothetical protein